MGIFERNVKGMTELLKTKAIGIAGCGGLGSNAAVALVRAGIGKLVLVDFDAVEESNLNRQYFFQSDIGKPKVDALAKHLKNINPDVELETYNEKIAPEKIEKFFKDVDILIEAFDAAESKKWLIENWSIKFHDKPIVCGSGLSGFGATSDIHVRKAGNIYLCGDEESDMTMGLCSARVAIAANMEANVAIELLITGSVKGAY